MKTSWLEVMDRISDFHCCSTIAKWNEWFTRFKALTRVADMDELPDKKKVALLVMKLQGISDILAIDVDTISYDELVSQLQKHFTPINVRQAFFQRRQRSDESFTDFAGSLKALSEPCNFHGLQDSIVRDVFLLNMHESHGRIKDKIRCHTDLTLQEAVMIANEFSKGSCEDSVLPTNGALLSPNSVYKSVKVKPGCSPILRMSMNSVGQGSASIPGALENTKAVDKDLNRFLKHEAAILQSNVTDSVNGLEKSSEQHVHHSQDGSCLNNEKRPEKPRDALMPSPRSNRQITRGHAQNDPQTSNVGLDECISFKNHRPKPVAPPHGPFDIQVQSADGKKTVSFKTANPPETYNEVREPATRRSVREEGIQGSTSRRNKSRMAVGDVIRVSVLFTGKKVYVCPSNKLDALSQLAEGMAEYFANESYRKLLRSPVKGMSCATQLSDKSWARARILSLNPENQTLCVSYTDIGGGSTIEDSNCFMLPRQFFNVPIFTFHISAETIANVEVGDIVDVRLIREMGPQSWCVEIKEQDSGKNLVEVSPESQVEATAKPMSHEEKSESQATAQPPPPEEQIQTTSTKASSEPAIPMDDNEKIPVIPTEASAEPVIPTDGFVRVQVVYCSPSGVTHVCLESKLEEARIMCEELYEWFSDPTHLLELRNPAIGMHCAAVYEEAWYRGIITSIDQLKQTADILYYDFGNIELMEHSQLWSLPQHFIEKEQFSVALKIPGVIPDVGSFLEVRLIRAEPDGSFLVIVKGDNAEFMGLETATPSVGGDSSSITPVTASVERVTVVPNDVNTSGASTTAPSGIAVPGTGADNTLSAPTTVIPSVTAVPSIGANNTSSAPTTVTSSVTAVPSTEADSTSSAPTIVTSSVTAVPSTETDSASCATTIVTSSVTAVHSTEADSTSSAPITVTSSVTAVPTTGANNTTSSVSATIAPPNNPVIVPINFKKISIPTNEFSAAEIVYKSPEGKIFAVTQGDFLDKMHEEVFLADKTTLANPSAGTLCLAPYAVGHGHEWYRVHIVRLNRLQTQAQVAYVDFGNEGKIDVKDLKVLPENYRTLPPFAFEIKVSDGVSVEEGDEIKIKPTSQDVDGVWFVEIQKELPVPEPASTAPVVIEPAVAPQRPPPPPIPEDVWTTVKVVYSGPEGVFAIESEKLDSDVLQLHQDLASVETFSLPNEPVVSDLYTAPFDGSYYRAKLLSISNKDCRVVFVDYGNELVLPLADLRVLPANVTRHVFTLKLPEGTAGTEGTILNVRPLYESDKGLWTFQIDKQEVAVQAPVLSPPEPTPPVPKDGVTALAVNTAAPECAIQSVPATTNKSDTDPTTSQIVNQIEVVKVPAPSPPEPTPPIPKDEFTAVRVMYSGKEGNFVITIPGLDVLEDIMVKISKLQLTPLTAPPVAGNLYLAPFDNDYYRARPLDFHAEACQVVFVDFGNILELPISHLRDLPSELASAIPTFQVNVDPADTALLTAGKDVEIKPLRMEADGNWLVTINK